MLALAVGVVGGAGCGGGSRAVATQAPPTSTTADAAFVAAPVVAPARLVPDVAASQAPPADVLADGTRRSVIAGIRLLEHPDGSVESARQPVPSGSPRVVDLPDRLGGGVLLVVTGGRMTYLWRAERWLGQLTPFAMLDGAALEIVAGFDRLYARMPQGNLVALDPRTGTEIAAGPLPDAPRIGPIAFADAWRAVAVLDVRGPVATFDAGMSWRPIALGDQPVLRAGAADSGDLVLDTTVGRYTLGATGTVQKVTSSEPFPGRGGAPTNAGAGASPPGPLGPRPLRAALADGWPDSPSYAIVARAGTLFRVRLSDGALIEAVAHAFPDVEASCHGVAVGRGFGFVCGSTAGPTVVYAQEGRMRLRELMRFSGPRLVGAGENGVLVVRGGCDRATPSDREGVDVAYCVQGREGTERTLRLRGELAEGRVVALADGRAVVLVPPSEVTRGSVVVFDAPSASGFDVARSRSVPLTFEAAAEGSRNAVWLEGFEERAPGVVGGWLDVGGALAGVRVGLEGTVQVSGTKRPIETTSFGGRFAFDWAQGGAAESVDGGMTWASVELTSTELLRTPGRDVRACGPVGCVGPAWLRVGWGAAPSAERTPPKTPSPSRAPLAPARALTLRCEPTGEVANALVTKPPPPPPTPVRPPERKRLGAGRPLATFPGGPIVGLIPTVLTPEMTRAKPKWVALRGLAAPTLAPGMAGLDAGTDPTAIVQMRAYAWGPKGADWSRTGKWLVRFDDRFDLIGARSTAPTISMWADEEQAADALGTTATVVDWNALLDPGGGAALLIACRGAPARCDLFGAAAGEPLVGFSLSETGTLARVTSAVRLGQTWFFTATPMGQSSAQQISIFRVDAGVVRKLARLPRVASNSLDEASLVRRVRGEGLGLLVPGAPGFGNGKTAPFETKQLRAWFVVPVDAETGEAGDPVRLLPGDLDGRVPPRCAPDADGWLLEVRLPLAPVIQAPAGAQISAGSWRLRVEPGAVCVDAMAATGDALAPALKLHPTEIDPRLAIPVTVTEPRTERRYGFRCSG